MCCLLWTLGFKARRHCSCRFETSGKEGCVTQTFVTKGKTLVSLKETGLNEKPVHMRHISTMSVVHLHEISNV